VFEGHVNAIRLVVRYGTPAQAAAAAADAIGGHLFAIWAAENPDAPLRLVGDRLAGSKTFASGAGIAANLVKLARLAAEAAVLDALRLAQQSVGIAAFVIGHPIERLSRDLGTYLRQPAMDMVLAEQTANQPIKRWSSCGSLLRRRSGSI
jgi:hypothetical protein